MSQCKAVNPQSAKKMMKHSELSDTLYNAKFSDFIVYICSVKNDMHAPDNFTKYNKVLY